MSDPAEQPAVRPQRAPLGLQAVALAGAVAALLLGLWVFASPVSRAFADATGVPAYWSSIGFAVAWFVAASIVMGKLRKERPGFGLPLRVAFLLTVAAVGGVFAVRSRPDDKADEDVSFAESAVPMSQLGVSEPEIQGPNPPPSQTVVLSSGRFSGIDHSAQGNVRVV